MMNDNNYECDFYNDEIKINKSGLYSLLMYALCECPMNFHLSSIIKNMCSTKEGHEIYQNVILFLESVKETKDDPEK